MLDGRPVGEIRGNSSTEMPIVAGTHTLQVRLLTLIGRRPGLGSPVVTFEVVDGDAAGFACRAPSYPQASFRWIAISWAGQTGGSSSSRPIDADRSGGGNRE